MSKSPSITYKFYKSIINYSRVIILLGINAS